MSVLADVNRDIWLPFRAAYATRDADAFAAFHHPDMVRVQVPSQWIGTRDEHVAQTAAAFAKSGELGDALAIDFRFDQRITSEDLAFERGIYELSIIAGDGTARVFYGRFNTIARRTSGGWRLILDQDDDEGGTVGEAQFLAGASIDDLAAFED